ncbi:MAG: beta-propeller domain-containing protein [Oscillospiraceae bacterium]|nr:beta-propeller domain-containing protein [Oscillospiraceae bacterium]
MDQRVKRAIRVSALVIVAALAGGLIFSQTGAISGYTVSRHSAVTLSTGETIGYWEVQKPPKTAEIQTEPKPSLPRVGDMTELLRLLNQMGVLYLEADAMVQDMGGNMKNSGADPAGDPGGVRRRNEAVDDEAEAADVAGAPMASPMPPASEVGGGGEHSETNAQVEGIAEGDIVKTDGQYLYIAQGTQVSIVKADGASMSVASVIRPSDSDDASIREMYVVGDRLVLVTSRWEAPPPLPPIDTDGDDTPDYRYNYWQPGKTFTGYDVYDISDRTDPSRFRLFELEGSPLETRLAGGILYFSATKHIYSTAFEQLEGNENDLLPLCRDTAAAEEATYIESKDICYFPGKLEASYLLLGAFDISKKEPCDVQSFLGAGEYFYMSGGSIYIAKPEWGEDGQYKTALYRFSVEGTSIQYEADGRVTGFPLNQYSMDEYNGYFRIATTDWESGNYVTVFDSAMNQTGRTPPLAPGESVKSARFMGDRGYVVTFRQVDPLFSLDLSDPKNPRVTGELKIPGFSQYMHPVGEDLMVGFGRHTAEIFMRHDDGTEEVVGVTDAGMKISLFDVSDPENPLEIDVLLLGQSSYSEATDNPRAMMVDAKRGLFGFPFESYDWDSSSKSWGGGMVVGVEGRSLVVRAELKDNQWGSGSWGSRLCYIGDTLYLCYNASDVTAYSYSSFAELNRLSLPQPQIKNAPVDPGQYDDDMLME